MDQSTLYALISLAIFIGITHTIMGPDHYIPFVAMSRAGKWSIGKTTLITVLCGIGHVLSSAVIGLFGVALGLAVGGLEAIEAVRGDIAGWLLLGFGVAYTAWGVHRAIRNKPHTHPHIHEDGEPHIHEHAHQSDHVHAHETEKSNRSIFTTWTLFTIFIFGPCEPLIPQLMYPAAKGNWFAVVAVTAAFGLATIGMMTILTVAGFYGLKRIPSMDRYSHAIAGIAIVMCGVAIKMGL
jgi:sulfite exporter TauE/SafE